MPEPTATNGPAQTPVRPFPWFCPKCRHKEVRRVTIPYDCERIVNGQPVKVHLGNFSVPQCGNCRELVFDYEAEEQINQACKTNLFKQLCEGCEPPHSDSHSGPSVTVWYGLDDPSPMGIPESLWQELQEVRHLILALQGFAFSQRPDGSRSFRAIGAVSFSPTPHHYGSIIASLIEKCMDVAHKFKPLVPTLVLPKPPEIPPELCDVDLLLSDPRRWLAFKAAVEQLGQWVDQCRSAVTGTLPNPSVGIPLTHDANSDEGVSSESLEAMAHQVLAELGALYRVMGDYLSAWRTSPQNEPRMKACEAALQTWRVRNNSSLPSRLDTLRTVRTLRSSAVSISGRSRKSALAWLVELGDRARDWIVRDEKFTDKLDKLAEWLVDDLSIDQEMLFAEVGVELDQFHHDQTSTLGIITSENHFMKLAIAEARKSLGEDRRAHPKVGAVVVKDGNILACAHRGELGKGEHAEYTALERKLTDSILAGATVYTTLEPCMTRNHPKIPCARRLIERKIGRVVIGMLDPNPAICGKGERLLRDHGIVVDRFPHDLILQLEDLNREFTRAHAQASATAIIDKESSP
jgi:pyrimidine deaminase RibD-like protein